jgi:arginine-tRNA-protein transferase
MGKTRRRKGMEIVMVTMGTRGRLRLRRRDRPFIEEEYELWKRYQAAVHEDAPSELRRESYARFLVESPIVAEPPRSDTPSVGYGAFHQQYRMDGRLIAVGVVDSFAAVSELKVLFLGSGLRALVSR